MKYQTKTALMQHQRVRLACKGRPCKGAVRLALGAKPVGTASFALRPDRTTTAYVRVSRLMASACASTARSRSP